MIVFRQADPRYPFLWSDAAQPAARWHAEGQGPAHYFADTPHGAWAELLRHEEITDAEDAATIRRALWAIEIGDEPMKLVSVPVSIATGDRESYPACQEHASRLRTRGAHRLMAPSAALIHDAAAGRRVDAGHEIDAPPRDGRVIIVFGDPRSMVGWKVVEQGAPPVGILPRVRHFRGVS